MHVKRLKDRIALAERRLLRGIDRRVEKHGIVYESEVRERLLKRLRETLNGQPL